MTTTALDSPYRRAHGTTPADSSHAACIQPLRDCARCCGRDQHHRQRNPSRPLLVLAHSADRSDKPATTADDQPPEQPCTAPDDRPARTLPPEPSETASVRTPPHSVDRTPQEFTDLAVLLCARDPARRRAPELLAQALTRHHIEGWNPTRIARQLNKSRSTISRILSDATTITKHRRNGT